MARTCREQGWSENSVARLLKGRPSYERFVERNRAPRRMRMAEAVACYRQKREGFKSLAKRFGVRPYTLLRRLKSEGIYQPIPNLPNPKAPRSKQAEKERRSIIRNAAAACLRAVKNGETVEGFCKAHSLITGSIRRIIYSSNGYEYVRKMILAKAKTSHKKQYARRRTFGWISNKWKDESAFQNSVEQALLLAGVAFEREVRLNRSRSRVDFVVRGHDIECKTQTNSSGIYGAIGQMLQYKHDRGNPVALLIPDDTKVRPDLVELIQSLGGQIICESAFIEWAKGGMNLSVIATRHSSRAAQNGWACRICGSAEFNPSTSPSRGVRSYCIHCADAAKSMRWDGKRWVPLDRLLAPF